MEKLRLSVPRNELGKEVECIDLVAGWLHEMNMHKLKGDASESGKDVGEEKETANPTTPPRRPLTPALHEEISPTDTSFSGHSIFDVPLRRTVHFGSPTSKRQIRDDTSDITSVGDDAEWELPFRKEQLIPPPAVPNFAQRNHSPAASLDSYDPLSVDEEQEEVEVITEPSPVPEFPLYDPDAPRLVWITSCLQCTLANLPCSRTHPACSRCKRKGYADDCLLHRRTFAIEALDPENCKMPMLLKVRGNDEESWQRKVKLAEELREEWVAEQEKNNWVMPDIGSLRATLKERVQLLQGEKIKKKDMLHPGEGLGRKTCKELVVDLNA